MSNEDTVLVSVVVPVYQVEKYIERCLKSIINQTFIAFELILVNDGTKDKSISIAEAVMDGSHIVYSILNKSNGGLSSARNYGLKHAKGKYVVFVDSDDELEPNYLETLYYNCEKEGASLSIGKYVEIHNNKLKNSRKDRSDTKINVVDNIKLCQLFFQRDVEAHPCTVMYSREFLENNNLYFNEKVLFSEDQEFYWRAFPLINKAVIIDKPIYRYYVNPGTITTNPKIEKILSGYKNVCETAKLVNIEGIAPNDIVLRWVLGTLHGTAKFCTFDFYLKLFREMNYRKMWKDHHKCFSFTVESAMIFTYLMPRISYFLYRI